MSCIEMFVVFIKNRALLFWEGGPLQLPTSLPETYILQHLPTFVIRPRPSGSEGPDANIRQASFLVGFHGRPSVSAYLIVLHYHCVVIIAF